MPQRYQQRKKLRRVFRDYTNRKRLVQIIYYSTWKFKKTCILCCEQFESIKKYVVVCRDCSMSRARCHDCGKLITSGYGLTSCYKQNHWVKYYDIYRKQYAQKLAIERIQHAQKLAIEHNRQREQLIIMIALHWKKDFTEQNEIINCNCMVCALIFQQKRKCINTMCPICIGISKKLYDNTINSDIYPNLYVCVIISGETISRKMKCLKTIKQSDIKLDNSINLDNSQLQLYTNPDNSLKSIVYAEVCVARNIILGMMV